MTTYLSGIQSTGLQHWGNYFGAIRRHIALVDEDPGGEHFYFIADLHALTTSRDPKELRSRTRETAICYLALGLDPTRATLWRQSEVPEVTELTWLLACVSGVGLLERAHSYKDKIAKGLEANVGLFTYPVLMAADILSFDTDLVPVGKDQVQHVEMTRDMAGSFNHAFKAEVFKLPKAQVPPAELAAKVPGLDGEKMSKSYGNDVWIFEHGKKLKKAIGRITTDSRPPEEPKDPGGLLLFHFLELFLPPEELSAWRDRVRKGGAGAPGYGHLKALLFEAVEEHFAGARARREEFAADPAEVDRILARGAGKARARAQRTLQRAYEACGIR